MINRFTITDNKSPQEVVSVNDYINDILFWIEEYGCGIRGDKRRFCEDFGCSSVLKIIEEAQNEVAYIY